MVNLTPEQIKAAKARGFLRNRGTDCFSGRVVVAGGVYSGLQLGLIGECAKRFGNGKVAMTSRLSAEIVGIPYDQIDAVCNFIEENGSGLCVGGTGPKIRPITACKGTTCVFGSCDTQALAARLHQEFYLGWASTPLPHKFKIAIGGCPNSCMKPSLNDFGIEARRTKGETLFRVFVGGTWGKRARIGDELSRLFREEELIPLLDKTLAWYRENAPAGERLGITLDRLGVDTLERALELEV